MYRIAFLGPTQRSVGFFYLIPLNVSHGAHVSKQGRLRINYWSPLDSELAVLHSVATLESPPSCARRGGKQLLQLRLHLLLHFLLPSPILCSPTHHPISPPSHSASATPKARTRTLQERHLLLWLVVHRSSLSCGPPQASQFQQNFSHTATKQGTAARGLRRPGCRRCLAFAVGSPRARAGVRRTPRPRPPTPRAGCWRGRA